MIQQITYDLTIITLTFIRKTLFISYFEAKITMGIAPAPYGILPVFLTVFGDKLTKKNITLNVSTVQKTPAKTI